MCVDLIIDIDRNIAELIRLITGWEINTDKEKIKKKVSILLLKYPIPRKNWSK